jgi:hypothetical protein
MLILLLIKKNLQPSLLFAQGERGLVGNFTAIYYNQIIGIKMSEENKTYFALCKKENGSVVFNGVEHAAIQQPYVSDDGETYQALAVSLSMLNKAGDKPGEHDPSIDETSTIYWEITCHNSDDESNACDWSESLRVEL